MKEHQTYIATAPLNHSISNHFHHPHLSISFQYLFHFFIELDYGKIDRKALYLIVKNYGFRLRFSPTNQSSDFFHILFQSSAAQVGLLFGSRLPGPVALQHPVATVRCGSRGLLTASCGPGRADVPRKRWNRRWKGRTRLFQM